MKESGKENSPPHEVIGAEEVLTNGHATPEEMVTILKFFISVVHFLTGFHFFIYSQLLSYDCNWF